MPVFLGKWQLCCICNSRTLKSRLKKKNLTDKICGTPLPPKKTLSNSRDICQFILSPVPRLAAISMNEVQSIARIGTNMERKQKITSVISNKKGLSSGSGCESRPATRGPEELVAKGVWGHSK